MKSRKQIEEQMNTAVVPGDRQDLRISIELLLDIRELLQKMTMMSSKSLRQSRSKKK